MKMTFIRHGKTAGNLEHRYVGRTDEPLAEAGVWHVKEMAGHYENIINADAIFVSPMKRCIETAEIILQNFGIEYEICDMNALEKHFVQNTDEENFVEKIFRTNAVEENIRTNAVEENIRTNAVEENIRTNAVEENIITNTVNKKYLTIVEDFREYDFGEFEAKNHEELMSNVSYRDWLDSNGAYDMPAGEGMDNFRKRTVRAFDETVKLCRKNNLENIFYIVHGGTIMAIFEKYDSEKKAYYDYMCKNAEGYCAGFDGNVLERVDK